MSNLTTSGNNGDAAEAAADDEMAALRLGNISLDLATFQVTVGVRPANLTYQEFELLRYMADFRDRVISFEVLSGLLWGTAGPRETRRLNVLVCRLRTKLRNSSPYCLETVRGRGYGLLNGAAGKGVTAGRERGTA